MDSALDLPNLPNSTVTSFFDFDEALEGIGTENDWFGNNDTEHNCTDHEMESTDINFVFHGVGISFLALFGIPANVLSVIVLKHPRMKSSLTTLLVGLTISDMFVISTSSLIFSFPAIFEYVKIFQWYTAIFHPILLPWLLPIALIAQMSSVYFTVVVTLERYIAVCLPLKARSFCTQRTARNSFIAVITLSVLYNMPRWFEYKAVLKSNCTDVFKYAHDETEMRLNVDYILYYVNLSYLLVIYLIPFSILLFFNITIYCEAKKQRCVRRNSLSPSMAHTSSSNSEDLALAGMLFGIVITFFACNMLSLVINVMESFGAEGFESLIPISNFLIVFGCSTNFVFYCVFGKQFRSHLTQTLGISKKSMKGGSGGSDNSTDNFRMTYNNSRNKAPAFIKTKWNSVNSAISNISSSVEHQPTNYYDYDSKPNRIIEEAAAAEDQDTNKNNVGEVSYSQVTVHTILSD